MNEQTIALIERLADALGRNAHAIIDTYTQYYIIASLGWIAFVALWVIAGATNNKLWACNEFWDDGVRWFVRAALIVLGGVFIFANIPSLLVPEATAINQLLGKIK